MAITYKSANIKREKNKYTLNWKLSSTTNVSNIKTRFSYFNGKGKKNVIKNDKVSKSTTSKSFTLDRKDFYPYTKVICKKIRIGIQWVGSNSKGAWETRDFKIYKPPAPSLSAITCSTDTTKLTFKSTLTGKDTTSTNAERQRCKYTLTRTTKAGSSKLQNDKDIADGVMGKVSQDITWTETKTSLPNDGDYIHYTLTARAQGLRGDSKNLTKHYYVGWAANLTISSVNVDKKQNNVVVNIKEDVTKYSHETSTTPITSITLQYCHTTSNDQTAWDWTDVTDVNTLLAQSKNCTVEALKNGYQKGEYIYVRLKSDNDMGSMFGYSEPWNVTELHLPDNESASTTEVKVTSAIAGTDGESVHAIIGWSNDSYNATLLAWSTDQDTWRSNTDPEKFELPDTKWEDETSQTSEYANSCTVKIKGLDEATTYYFRARRYDTEDDSSYSGWSEDITSCKTGTTPAGVTLTAPASIAYGKALTVAWVVGGERTQTAWQLLDVSDGEEIAIAAGDDATVAHTIPASYLADKEQITLQVKAATGGEFYGSNLCGVAIKQSPTITISDTSSSTTTGRVITTLPWTFDVKGKEGTQLSYMLVACGVTSAMPDYTQEQFEGDIIYSSTATISGTADTSGLVTNTIELPNTIQLTDTARYTLHVIPTYDDITGDDTSPSWTYTTTEDESAETPVTMEITTSDYTVDWEHKATASEDIAVVTDASALTATITPQAPTGAAEGDLCALYRVTPDGVYLIADDVKFGSSVTDRWAPYGNGELVYRVATKTDLGDYDWVDVEYSLTGKMLRIDWAENSVLLPYNIAINDSWEKDYEGVTYLDGSRQGYWNEGATHSASLSTDIIKVTDKATDRLLRDLAQYTDSVFVRTPNGQAYEGNISVSLDLSYDSAAVAVSLDAEETECTTFVCDASDIVEPTDTTETVSGE